MEEKIHIRTEKFPRLAYLKTGTGPVMVLLHGFPESGSLWREIWPSLATSFTVIVPDIPGSGDSSFEGEDISMEELAEAVANILDNEGISESVVAGHSMGGYIALAYAEKYAERLKGLALVHSTADADDEEKKETRRKSIRLIQNGGRETFIKQMVPNLFSAAFKENNPGILENEAERGLRLDDRSIIAFYNAMINRPVRLATLKNGKFPVQWIIGKEDNIIPPAKILPQTRLAVVNFVSVYADCAHMSMLEQPQRLADDLSKFGKYCYGTKS